MDEFPLGRELEPLQSLPPVSQLLAAADGLWDHGRRLNRVVQSNPWELLPGGREQDLLGSPRPGLLQNNKHRHEAH